MKVLTDAVHGILVLSAEIGAGIGDHREITNACWPSYTNALVRCSSYKKPANVFAKTCSSNGPPTHTPRSQKNYRKYPEAKDVCCQRA